MDIIKAQREFIEAQQKFIAALMSNHDEQRQRLLNNYDALNPTEQRMLADFAEFKVKEQKKTRKAGSNKSTADELGGKECA